MDRSGPRPMGGGGRRGCLSPPRGTTCLTGVAGGPGGSRVRRLRLLGGGVLLALLPGSPDGLRKRTGGPLTELVGRGHHSPLHQSPVFGFGGPETLVERPNDSGQRRKGTGARSAWIGGNSRRQDVLLACAIKRHRDVDGGLNAVEPVRVSIVRQRGYGGSDSRLGGRLVGRDPRPSGKRHQGDFRSKNNGKRRATSEGTEPGTCNIQRHAARLSEGAPLAGGGPFALEACQYGAIQAETEGQGADIPAWARKPRRVRRTSNKGIYNWYPSI